MIPTWVKVLAVVGAFAFAIYALRSFLAYEQDIGYQRAVGEYNVKLVAAQRKAAEDTAQLAKEKDDAIAKRIETEQKLAESKRAAAIASGGLRDTINDLRNRLSSDTIDACRRSANALADVFGQCSERLIEVARDADGFAADSLMLQKAWPHTSGVSRTMPEPIQP